MKKAFHFTVAICGTLLCYAQVYAQPGAVQPATADSSMPVSLFYKSISENAHLYNGTEYIMYDQHIKGDPYFITDVTNGSVYYDGTLYKNVPMLYELTSGNLVVRRYNGGVLMCLIKEKVGSFNLYNHTFIHLVPDSGNTVITNDFYDRIYNGKNVIYVRRQKILYEDPSTYERSFLVNDRYVINKNNTWYPVSSEGDVLKLFKDHKKELTKYLRQNKIKYKKAPEYAMIKMAEYYDTLTH